MAEYYISYDEMDKLVDELIKQSSNEPFLQSYKAEIMAALTGDFEQNRTQTINEMLFFWGNQVKIPSQFLLGSRYIQLNQVILDLLKVMFTTGFLEMLIGSFSQGELTGLSLTVGGGIVFGLSDLLKNVKTLNDWDFCVYMQAVTHYRQHKKFTMEEMRSWMPSESKPTCNMHNDTWACEYYDFTTDNCSIFEGDRLEQAIRTLQDKNLLKKTTTDDKIYYQFKW